jgi:hypothetical protein
MRLTKTNTGGPAFPGVKYKQPGGVGVSVMTIVGGMTLRDYFAAKAMQSVIARGDDTNRPGMAEWSYAMADAMMKVREA